MSAMPQCVALSGQAAAQPIMSPTQLPSKIPYPGLLQCSASSFVHYPPRFVATSSQSSRFAYERKHANDQSPAPSSQGFLAAASQSSQLAYERKHSNDRDPHLRSLTDLRQVSGLQNVAVGEGLSTLKYFAEDGLLSRERFLQAYAHILNNYRVSLPSQEIQNAVFDLFDRDGNHVVDLMELISGIALMCKGTQDEKIEAVFHAFDENGDQHITLDEMFKFLSSVFKAGLSPSILEQMNAMGVTVESPEDLASITAMDCFREADLSHDGRLSMAEFKEWFGSDKHDPGFLFHPLLPKFAA